MLTLDPLDEWRFVQEEVRLSAPQQAELEVLTHATLEGLAQALDNPTPKGVNLDHVRMHPRMGPQRLAPDDQPLAQDLYRRLYAAGGSRSRTIQEALLHVIGQTPSADAIPFWRDLLDNVRPRDTFATTQRRYALAALAFLAIQQGSPAAYGALHAATRHAHADVRAQAVPYLGRAYLEAGQPLPEEVQADLARLARQDKTFPVRFAARQVLRAAGVPVPRDHPGGVYVLKVTYKGTKGVSRTIELLSQQSLEDLHEAIQQAYAWDNDHLYSFYMSGKLRDQQHEIQCPQGADYRDDGSLLVLGGGLALIIGETGITKEATEEETTGDEETEEEAFSTVEAVVGELGLAPKQTFLYLFDYGDEHLFDVEVVEIRPQAAPGEYPRLVASQGPAPAQYADWDDDEDGDAEDEDGEDDGDAFS